MSAKFDKEICNGLVSIVFTRSTHGRTEPRTHGRTEPQQRYYIPTATRCAGITHRNALRGDKNKHTSNNINRCISRATHQHLWFDPAGKEGLITLCQHVRQTHARHSLPRPRGSSNQGEGLLHRRTDGAVLTAIRGR